MYRQRFRGGSMTDIKFFVYGSMSEGFVHFTKIKDFVQHSEPATAQATAYRLKVGFPVLLEQGNDLVPGDLVELKSTSSIDLLVVLLDEFHGVNRVEPEKSLYYRKEISVNNAAGIPITSWCYFLNPSKLPSQSQKIDGGDWRSLLHSEPAMTSKLTERQKNYIQRLGSSSGREIVPIDLPLYRELMNLELIVDKGRRLALSKLGQELYRYL